MVPLLGTALHNLRTIVILVAGGLFLGLPMVNDKGHPWKALVAFSGTVKDGGAWTRAPGHELGQAGTGDRRAADGGQLKKSLQEGC